MMEKKHRIDDALEAVRAAQEAGIVPGGGIALFRASSALEGVYGDNEEQNYGIQVIHDACTAPLRQMAINAGESPDLIIQKVSALEDDEGFDFLRRETTNLFESGIIDPCKVTTSALQNAASAAGTLLTTSHAIVCT